jgi:hypothetical protein
VLRGSVTGSVRARSPVIWPTRRPCSAPCPRPRTHSATSCPGSRCRWTT